jgi:hypothetical protein
MGHLDTVRAVADRTAARIAAAVKGSIGPGKVVPLRPKRA